LCFIVDGVVVVVEGKSDHQNVACSINVNMKPKYEEERKSGKYTH